MIMNKETHLELWSNMWLYLFHLLTSDSKHIAFSIRCAALNIKNVAVKIKYIVFNMKYRALISI